MSDTVTATQAWITGDVQMNFLAPQEPPQGAGNLHVPGGAYSSTYASPSLVVQFTSAFADFQPSGAAPPADPAPPTISGYAAGLPNDLPPVIVGALNIT